MVLNELTNTQKGVVQYHGDLEARRQHDKVATAKTWRPRGGGQCTHRGKDQERVVGAPSPHHEPADVDSERRGDGDDDRADDAGDEEGLGAAIVGVHWLVEVRARRVVAACWIHVRSLSHVQSLSAPFPLSVRFSGPVSRSDSSSVARPHQPVPCRLSGDGVPRRCRPRLMVSRGNRLRGVEIPAPR